MRTKKSNPMFYNLIEYPFIVRYAKNGLVNLNALARLVRLNKKAPAAGMGLRRYIASLPEVPIEPFDFSKYKLQLVTRTNIHEIILNKNLESRSACLKIVGEVSKTKYFVSVVEGEKEIVVMTDHPLPKSLLAEKLSSQAINDFTRDLAFISVDFPIEMRGITGIYSLVTSCLAESGIPIHSFHTIGGEILILVKNEDLIKTEEVLRLLLFKHEVDRKS